MDFAVHHYEESLIFLCIHSARGNRVLQDAGPLSRNNLRSCSTACTAFPPISREPRKYKAFPYKGYRSLQDVKNITID